MTGYVGDSVPMTRTHFHQHPHTPATMCGSPSRSSLSKYTILGVLEAIMVVVVAFVGWLHDVDMVFMTYFRAINCIALYLSVQFTKACTSS